MKTRQDILTEVFNSQCVQKIGYKFNNLTKNDVDDYIGYCLQAICEIPEDKLLKLYNTNQLYFYVVSVCKNQLFNKKSEYNKLMENNIDKVNFEDAKGNTEAEV